MPEQRQLWPLLAYGALSVVAFARRGGLRPRSGPSAKCAGAGAQPASDGGAARTRRERQEHGRGRHAAAPWDIPWRGWKDILWRTYAEDQR